ncbi:MAG: hypothetical protein ACOX6D_05810 [Thermoguttaceae bacterium]
MGDIDDGCYDSLGFSGEPNASSALSSTHKDDANEFLQSPPSRTAFGFGRRRAGKTVSYRRKGKNALFLPK